MIMHVEVLAESLHRPNKYHLLLFLIIKKKQGSWCPQISLGRVSGAWVLTHPDSPRDVLCVS